MSTRPIAMLRPCDRPDVRFEERDRARFCHACGDVQYDFRDATESEVDRLLVANGGRVCGRIRVGPDGTPRFRPEPSRGVSLLRGAAIALALAGCGSHGDEARAPPLESSADDGVDHSTDTSADPADHSAHVHAHAPVTIAHPGGRTEEAEGMMGRASHEKVRNRYAIVPTSTTPPSSGSSE